ncbi:MAG: hypothetical protein FJ056_05610 [Cyanobacteria bacterium M_surface_10_m2_179]|nr:hypothetical protein [Cyanobacteria bacterium M_surface_10_m2_179]
MTFVELVTKQLPRERRTRRESAKRGTVQHHECIPMIPPESAAGKTAPLHLHPKGSETFLNGKPGGNDMGDEANEIHAVNA